jgi:hypothetical protein
MSDNHDAAYELALASSRGCPHCEGNGLVTVFNPSYVGLPATTVLRHGEPFEVAVRAAGVCCCSLGDWYLRSLTKTASDILERVPVLSEVLAGGTTWTERDPSAPLPVRFAPGYRPTCREVFVALGVELGEVAVKDWEKERRAADRRAGEEAVRDLHAKCERERFARTELAEVGVLCDA